MKIEHLSNDHPIVIGILLSERNLESLLAGLRSDPSVERSFLRSLGTTTVVIMAERDAAHYDADFPEIHDLAQEPAA